MSSKKQLIFLILISGLLFFLFNNQLLITDSVESNYALTAKEMVKSGDWLSPQIYGKYWYDKPIFFYWQTASAFQLFGFTEFAARFWPSLIGIFSVLLIYWFGNKLYSPSVGIISGLILATSLEFWVLAKSIITDSSLFLFFNGALAFFYLAYRGKEKHYYYLFYFLCGLATLTKGPIGFLLPGLILTIFLFWNRNWSELKQMKIFFGILVFLITATPWYYMMYLRHGEQFLQIFFGVHNFLRATVSEHPEYNVTYYYLVILLIGFFPWIAFLPQTIKNLWKEKKESKKLEQNTVFLAIWVITVFIFFQLMATKYSTYTFPTLFPLSLLVASFIDKEIKKPESKFFYPSVYIFLFSFLLLIGGGIVLKNAHWPLNSLLPLLTTTLLGGGYCLYLAWKRKNQRLFLALLTVVVIFNLLLIKDVFVPLTHYRSAKGVGIELKEQWKPGTIIGTYGDYKTSAVFYSDCKIFRLVERNQLEQLQPKAFSWTSKNVMPFMALEDLKTGTPAMVIVRERNYQQFLQQGLGHWKTIIQVDDKYLLSRVE